MTWVGQGFFDSAKNDRDGNDGAGVPLRMTGTGKRMTETGREGKEGKV